MVQYALKRSHRAKRIILRVVPGQGLVVVVPAWVDEARLPGLIGQALASRRDWIESTLARLCPPDVGADSQDWPDGRDGPPERLDLAALGRGYRIEALTASGPAELGVIGPDRLYLRGTQGWQDALKGFLKQAARVHLGPWLRRTSLELGLEFARFQVRLQRGRWASCSSKGTISLNAKLLFLEPELVRYVFVHELCHLRHMDHSPAFKALLASLEPECATLERRLRSSSRLVPGWVDG